MKLTSKEEQKSLTETIISSDTSKHDIMLRNVIRNITICFANYTVDDITRVFNNVYNTKANQKPTEPELTQTVLKKLQNSKVSTKKRTAAKISVEEMKFDLATMYK